MTAAKNDTTATDRSIAVRYGRNLRRERDRAGFTQAQLAQRAGLHRTAIGLLELGERSASFETTVRLAGALGVPAGTFLQGIAWEPDARTGRGVFMVVDDDA